MTSYNLTHLRQLEAESIHIIREVAAEFENPVMLYSIGKDSAVMVRLAEKAFSPAKPPFPLMHIDTTWKFREMYRLRDEYVAQGARLQAARARQRGGPGAGDQPDHARQQGPHRRDEDAGPAAGARQAPVRRRLRRRPPRRGEEPGQGAGVLVPRRVPPLGSEEPAARALEPLQHEGQEGGEHPRLSPLQLDRTRRLAVHPPREHPARAALLRQGAADRVAGRRA